MTSSSDFERHVTGRGRIPDESVLGEGIDEILQVRSIYLYFTKNMVVID